MSTTSQTWYDVNREGLAAILEHRGKGFAVAELIQNVWDLDGATTCSVHLVPIPERPEALLVVEDDHPDGFTNLADAWTLFARSEKGSDPTKRGRFNLGEKLVLALCSRAQIQTTSGTVTFDADGTRTRTRARRPAGSRFEGVLRMTRAELDATLDFVSRLLPPPGIHTEVNGLPLLRREPLASFTVPLATVTADAEGILRPTVRKTRVDVYEVTEGGPAHLYELGIPVVATGDRWHLDIQQKVPVNLERDNVPPSYLRTLHVETLNALASRLDTAEAATASWVQDATSDPRAAPAAVARVLDLRFGTRRVAFDPSDPEANKLATSKGYTVIHGGTLSAGQWENVRRDGAALPAGQVTLSPTAWSKSPDAKTAVPLPEGSLSEGMRLVEAAATELARRLLGVALVVTFYAVPNRFAAAYAKGGALDFNVQRLGRRWFARGLTVEVLDLLLHEFGHEASTDHLSEAYHDALTRLGARLAFEVAQDHSLLARYLVFEETEETSESTLTPAASPVN